MQSNEYKIERWDAIYDDKLNLKRPLVYIIPDKTLIDFSEINKDTLYATIKGTGNDCYDNKAQVSLVSVKETRPNLFNKTGYYTLHFKDIVWVGYPSSLGTVSFEGVNKQVEDKTNNILPSETELQSTKNQEEPSTIEKFMNLSINNKPNLIIVVLAVLLIILLLVRFLPK